MTANGRYADTLRDAGELVSLAHICCLNPCAFKLHVQLAPMPRPLQPVNGKYNFSYSYSIIILTLFDTIVIRHL